MTARWREQVRLAEHERLGRGQVGQLVVLFGASLARTLVQRAAIALTVISVLMLLALAAIVALWPELSQAVRDLGAIAPV